MAQFLYRRFAAYGWLEQNQRAEVPEFLGIIIRVKNGDSIEYISEPQTVDYNIKTICANLDLAVIFTMSSEITHLLFTRISKDESEITLPRNNITIPVVESLQVLARDGTGVRRRDFCCLVRKEKVVLVWGNSAEEIIVRGSDVESKLISSVHLSTRGVIYLS